MNRHEDLEEDPVVRELDVYVSDMKDLSVLQFPLRPVYSSCPNVTSAKIKPSHNILELQVPYNASIFAPDRHDDRPTHQKLVSSKLEKRSLQTAAVVRDGELHLTPVQDILQVRPCFDETRSREVTENIEEEKDEEDKKAPLQQVHMRRKENERAETVRKHSYVHIKNLENSEPWKTLNVHDIESNASCERFEDLYCTH